MEANVLNGAIQTVQPAADYPEKEHNPRGCSKGAAMMNLIYGPDRLKKPMLHNGKPGEDKFREASWNEALDYTARELKRIMNTYGPESVGFFIQVAGTGYIHKGALIRLANLNGWSVQGGYDMNGDLPMHSSQTFGVQSEELESYQWVDSKYTTIWGSNIYATRTPDAPMLQLAQEKGSKVVVFDPHYSPTAAKADEWFSIKNSSDASVALGIAKVIIEENLYDADFIRNYTDLPILIRSDNKKRLLASSVEGINDIPRVPEYREVYAVYNRNVGSFFPVNPETLNGMSRNVALEGEFTVKLKNGQEIKVKPAFQLLKESIQHYTPESVERTSGMPAKDLPRIAREMTATKPMHIIYGASNYQWYHGDLKGRALSLLAALTGNIGTQGGGISTLAGQYRVRIPLASWWVPTERNNFKPPGQKSLPFQYMIHGKTDTMSCTYPEHGIKAWIMLCGNPFDQHNLSNILREQVEKGQLELVVNLDFQKTTSSRYSHVLLPGVSWYEKTELTASPLHPYLQLMQPAIEPVGECKPELWIFRELAKRLGEGQEQYFYPEYANDPDKATEEIIKIILKGGPLTEGITLEQLQKGPVKMVNNHPGGKRIPYYDQIALKRPFPPQSFPNSVADTAKFVKSGRIQFYRDEDTFIKLGEQLPTHKPPFEDTEYALDPTARTRFPFAYLTTNSIHRVHSTHSNNVVFRELQNDSAKVFMNPEDARSKGIAYGDNVEVFNDRGKVRGEAVLDAGIQQGSVLFEQGWWSRYTGGTSYNSLIYPFINPTHEVYFLTQIWSPNTNWNECVCDVKKVVKR
jgi:anaerobic selenocysteine-containing dehydrogenase